MLLRRVSGWQQIPEKITYMNSNIFSRMAQVTLFYYLTLTTIFKVKKLGILLFCEYLASGKKDQTLLLS